MRATDAEIRAFLKRHPPQIITGLLNVTFDLFSCGYCAAVHKNMTKHVRSHLEPSEDA